MHISRNHEPYDVTSIRLVLVLLFFSVRLCTVACVSRVPARARVPACAGVRVRLLLFFVVAFAVAFAFAFSACFWLLSCVYPVSVLVLFLAAVPVPGPVRCSAQA